MRKRLESRSKPAEPQSSHASIAEAMFTKVVEEALNGLQAKLPNHVAPQHMDQWILSFLDRAAERVHIRGRNGKVSSVGCLDKIERNLVAADPQEYRDIIVPFWTAPDFPVLQGLLFDLRDKADNLGLKARDVVPVLRTVLGRRLPDTRPLKVQRGELRDRIISELVQIKARTKEFNDFESLRRQFPKFKVVEIVSGSGFDDDYRNYVASPGQWETKTATFGHGILKKFWGLKSEETVKGYHKAYRASKKDKG
jgi:hypothetical protein